MSIGLALAGGGLKCVAYIGVFKAIEELGIKIDYISGTSSGSAMAAMYAIGLKPEEMKKCITSNYEKLVQIEKRPIISAATTYIFQKKIKIEGLIPGEKVEELISKIAMQKNIENIQDIKIPFAVPTVDTISTKECIFISKKYDIEKEEIDYIYEAPIGKAIRASMAFPGIFTTCKFGKYNFIDGGTKDNLPVEVLKDMGAQKVIGINFNLDPYNPEGKNILDILLRTCDIFSLKDVIKAQKEADLSIKINAPGSSLLTFDNIEENIKIGYDAIMNSKEKILDLIREENEVREEM